MCIYIFCVKDILIFFQIHLKSLFFLSNFVVFIYHSVTKMSYIFYLTIAIHLFLFSSSAQYLLLKVNFLNMNKQNFILTIKFSYQDKLCHHNYYHVVYGEVNATLIVKEIPLPLFFVIFFTYVVYPMMVEWNYRKMLQENQ